MIPRIVVAALTLLVSASVAAAQQPQVKKAPIKPTPASNAKVMFETYCAVCHGKDGKGSGPAASALKQAPADLTKISARNNGTYPEVRVKRFIEGLDTVAAHGTRDMPMWGDVFRALNRDTALIRIQALADLIKGMQVN